VRQANVLSISDPRLVRAVGIISQRSERESDSKRLVQSFVDTGILAQVDNSNNQIIFGRRGTGKTHLLRVLQAECEKSGMVAVYMDARVLGSSAQHLDPTLPLAHRCLALFRDLMSCLHTALLDFVVNGPAGPGDLALALVDELAKSFADDSVRAETNAITVKSVVNKKLSEGLKLASSLKEPAGIEYSDTAETGSQRETTAQVTVTKEDKIFYPSIHSILARLLSSLNTKVFLLMDEWSSLPQDIQPYVADFLRRTMFANPSVVVKIAALEQRSAFSLRTAHGVVGFELGSDIGASVDLDDYYVYDKDPDSVVKAFTEMLYRHVNGGMPEGYLEINGVRRSMDLRSALFEPEAFHELVHASEGVPRDLIFIFVKAFFSAHRKQSRRIQREFVQQEARQWYEQDKYQNLDDAQRRVLDAIIRQVVVKAHSITFLVLSEDEKNAGLQQLLDARIVHLLRRGFVDSGARYSVFNLDFGTYAHLDTSIFVPFGSGRLTKKLIVSPELLLKARLPGNSPLF